MRLLALGDVHSPYIDPAMLNKAIQSVRRFKPDIVLQVGDAYEQDNGSNWAPNGEREKPSEEIARGREILVNMWATVRRHAPKARLIQTWGNHDVRYVKRVAAAAPGALPFVEAGMQQLMAFDGVESIDAEEVPLGRIAGREWTAVHGHATGKGAHATHYSTNIVCGHVHKGYVVTVPGGYIELNVGWLGANDHHSKNFAKARRQNWNHGIGVIDDDGPRFIPFGTEAGK